MACSERCEADRTCRFRRINGGGFRLAFEVTRRCDLACGHCFNGPIRPDPALEAVTGVIRQAGQLNCRKIILTGGEPLVRRDLERIVAAAVAEGILVDLNSNLYSLTTERAKALKSAGLQEASVSLYGGGRLHDELTHRSGSFERTLHGMDLLLDAGITVDIHGAIWDDMIHEIPDLIETARHHGAASISFFTLLPNGRRLNWERYRLTPARALDALVQARRSAAIPVRTVGLRAPEAADCVMGKGVFGLDVDLRLSPCLLSFSRDGGVNLFTYSLREAFQLLEGQIQQNEWRMRCHPLAIEGLHA